MRYCNKNSLSKYILRVITDIPKKKTPPILPYIYVQFANILYCAYLFLLIFLLKLQHQFVNFNKQKKYRSDVSKDVQ